MKVPHTSALVIPDGQALAVNMLTVQGPLTATTMEFVMINLIPQFASK